MLLGLLAGGLLRPAAADDASSLRWKPAGPIPAAEAFSAGREPSTRPAAQDDLLVQASALASEGRWHEIVRLYEPAVREGTLPARLHEHYDLARIHCDIERRYAERSFREDLAGMSERDATRLYTELLGRIASHHVDQPDYRHLVGRGCRALEAAICDDCFLRHLGITPTMERVELFRQQATANLRQRRIASPAEAESAATWIARLAQATLGIPPSVTMMEFAAAAMGGLDEYSAFLTSGQLDDLYAQIDGNFVGLGVELKPADDGLLIVHVIPGSPAERSGLRAGDHLVGVGGRSIGGLGVDEAASLLEGPEGSLVTLAILRGRGPARAVTVRREHVEVPSIEEVRMLEKAGGIGYLRITSFQKTTAADLEAALRRLEAAGMRSLVIDLRGNPGGLLSAGVDAADLFLDSGLVVATRGRSPEEDFNYLATRPGTRRMPIAVVIDGDSASASEIFAGAIRDHRRGVIVGSRSYGKGSVQGIFPLEIGGMGMRLTTAKFYSPRGGSFSRIGVEPDVAVRTAMKPLPGAAAGPSAEDPYLQAAVQSLRAAGVAAEFPSGSATAAR